MQLTSEQVKSQQLGHLGLIAATLQELGIIARIDKRLTLNKDKGGLVSQVSRHFSRCPTGHPSPPRDEKLAT